jgi:outer membrane immunogenic protein
MKRFGAVITAALLLTSAAQAADLGWNTSPSTMYSPAPAASWSGFYAGINGGYGRGTTIIDPTGASESEDNNSGWSLGGQVGYNADMGGFVLGGEADLQWSSVGYSEDLGDDDSFNADTDLFGTIRARGGMAFGQVMPYVTAGLAVGRGSASIEQDEVTTSRSATHFGWTAGVGLEAKATDNISFKAEYLYVDLGKQAYDGLPGGDNEITQRFGLVRAGINYKF